MTEHEIDDDDIRAMLHAKAAEATVSPDAWERISGRIAEPQRRSVGRRLALAGAAAAAVSGTVVVANLPGSPTSQVASPTTTAPIDGSIAPSSLDPVIVATEWLRLRWRDVDLPEGRLHGGEDGSATVLFLDDRVGVEVFVRQLSGRPGWTAVSAASDMIPVFGPTYVDGRVTARATAEAAGMVIVTFVLDDGTEIPGLRTEVGFRGDVRIDQGGFEADAVSVRVELHTPDGGRYLSEVQSSTTGIDPAFPAGSHVALWPAVDSAGLAELQRQADAGERADLLDPREVASSFLSEVLGTTDGWAARPFRQGDATSGEVAYELGDGDSAGAVLLRRSGGEGAVWYVTGATSDVLSIEQVRREETHLVADVRSTRAGTLEWTGAVPVQVAELQTVSIGRPDTPLGDHPVVIRLVQGGRTVALTGGLG